MKIPAYKPFPLFILALALSLPLLGWGNNPNGPKGKHTKEKSIKREFSVNANALLRVDNSYGNLNITSWDENRVIIEVRIQTNGNNEEKVQKRLEEITVAFENSSSEVYAKTIFNKGSSGWGNNNNNVNVQVDYNIKVPVGNQVNLSNDYGGISLDRIDGNAKISCDYGRLDLGELNGRNNQLNFDYTSNSNIDFLRSGNINADYSGFTIEKAGDLSISADYTNATIGTMGNLQYNSDYGTIAVKEAKNVQGTGDYISVKLGKLYGNVSLRADYGSIKIGEMTAQAGNLQIQSDYTGIKIGYAANYHFDFEIKTEYAGVRGKEGFDMAISKEKSTENYYKGHYGKANSGRSVSLDSNYGGITFYKNN